MRSWQTYREALIHNFDDRKARRPQYSLRAFARDLGVTPSHLSDVLSKRRGLSLHLATQIADSLEFLPEQRQLFINLVESEDARSPHDRARAVERLRAHNQSQSTVVRPDEIDFLNAWYIPATLELITVSKGRIDASGIAAALGVDLKSAAQSLETLLRLGIVQLRESVLARTRDYLHIFSDDSNAILRAFHRSVLKLTDQRLEQIPPTRRQNLSTILSIDSSRIDEAKADLLEAHSEFVKKYSASEKADAVFVFNQNFFQADIGST